MRIIEIAPLSNGAHRNQSGDIRTIPAGWAVIPNDLVTENFPFGEVTAEEIGGVMTVTSWVAGELPEPEPMPDPEPTEMDKLRADVDYIAMEMGVDL